MAECSSTQPVKSILKRSHETRKTSETNNTGGGEGAGIKWDEMNILMTEHPLDKDYGHMKIDEPKTPYNYEDDVEEESTSGTVCPGTLTDKVKEVAKEERGNKKYFSSFSKDDSDEELTAEQKEQKEGFKQWRKKHYDEYHNIQRARMLLAAEQDEEDDEEEDESMDNVS